MMRTLTHRTSAFVVTLALLFGASTSTASAYVAGQPGKMSLSPSTSTATTGQQFTVDIKLDTAGIAASGLAVRLTYPIPATPDLEVVSITPNTTLGFTFPFAPTSYVSGNKMYIDFAGANGSTLGYTSTGQVTLATITFRASSAFSNKSLTFEPEQTTLLKKSDAMDFLGTITPATVTATGATTNTITPSPTPTTAAAVASPTPTTAAAAGTTPTPDAGANVGGGNVTTTTVQTQAQPVSGSTTATLGLIGLGSLMVIGALYLRTKAL